MRVALKDLRPRAQLAARRELPRVQELLARHAASIPLSMDEAARVLRWMRDNGDGLVAAVNRYEQAWPGGSAARNEMQSAATAQASAEGSLSLETTQDILRWGFGREARNLTEDSVRQATTEAFRLRNAGDQKGAMKILSRLPGVGPSSASKILAASAPDRSAIFDSRVAHGLRGLTDADGGPMIPTPAGRIIEGTASPSGTSTPTPSISACCGWSLS